MVTVAKQVADGIMNREKTLGLPWGFEPAHLSFSLPRRLLGDFRAVVLPTSLAMRYTGCPFTCIGIRLKRSPSNLAK
jgi:hypothetical protein